MRKTEYRISKMDCPSEERLIRMKLERLDGIKKMDFDIPNRRLMVFHADDSAVKMSILLAELNLGATLIKTENTEPPVVEIQNNRERTILWWVLGINFGFFLFEIIMGYFSESMGLVADSLDMLADSFVYGLSLMAVGGSVLRKRKVAKVSGYFQMTLAVLGFGEVIRRFLIVDTLPGYHFMIIVSMLALTGNLVCLYLLHSAKSDDAHMKASWIFTSNDVLANIGVILAAILIIYTKSNLPDLIVGSLVFGLVLRGAFRILKLAK